MDRLSRKLISFILVICLLFTLLMPVGAVPSAVEIVTTPSGYTTAADVVYVTEGDIVLNWGARGEDCTFLTTYAQSYYTDGIEYDDLSQLSGGTSATDAPDSELYDALQDLMVSKHTTFTKYGGSSALDCKKFYHYTDCMLSDPSYVSTLYRGTIVGGLWDGGKSYNQEHVWPQSKCIGTASQDVGDLMQLRPAVPNENSSRNNTAYGESDGYYDPGISVRGDCAHNYSSKVTLAVTCTSPGIRKYTCATCGYSYTETIASLGHSYSAKVTAPTCTAPGYTTYTCSTCTNSYTGDPTAATGHSYSSSGVCTKCGTGCSHAYSYKVTQSPTCTSNGIREYLCATCGHTYTETITPLGHDYHRQLTEPTCTTQGHTSFTCATCGDSYIGFTTPATGHSYATDGVCTKCGISCSHNYSNKVTQAATCTTPGTRKYTCAICGMSYTEAIPATGHIYSGGYCLVCGASDGTLVDFYLFGYINGANYACEEDWQNLGQYKFVNGKLTATFLTESYVAFKTSDNINWFMSNSYIETNSGTFYHTSTGATEKMKIPGGVEVTFTLVQNKDGSVSLSYTTEAITVTDPGLSLSYPTLSFEDEIIYNVYYSVKDTTSVVEMGLMILPMMDQNATVEDATALVPGHVTNGTVYLTKSRGIPAANMGDTLYFKVYAKLADGSYAYSSAGGYNAKAYARSILNGNNSRQMKALVVSMLNYGAEAHLYFGHNTGALVNNALTADQQALVSQYDATMMDAIVKADSNKTTNFVRVNSNFRQLYPSVSFDGAFAINFYCAPAVKVDSGMTLYYWDMETMASVDKLTVENATGSMEMTDTNGMWWGQVAGIAAKEMDDTYYVSCVFESDGETITTGVIPYSLGKYCSDKAAADGDAQQAFAQATAVYGYYAKNYFASIA